MADRKLAVVASWVVIVLCGFLGPVQVRAGETGGRKESMIDLWPDEYLVEKGISRGVLEPSKGDNIARLTEVSIPTLTVYKAPSAKAPTPAVMVCPGGGVYDTGDGSRGDGNCRLAQFYGGYRDRIEVPGP